MPSSSACFALLGLKKRCISVQPQSNRCKQEMKKIKTKQIQKQTVQTVTLSADKKDTQISWNVYLFIYVTLVPYQLYL